MLLVDREELKDSRVEWFEAVRISVKASNDAFDLGLVKAARRASGWSSRGVESEIEKMRTCCRCAAVRKARGAGNGDVEREVGCSSCCYMFERCAGFAVCHPEREQRKPNGD